MLEFYCSDIIQSLRFAKNLNWFAFLQDFQWEALVNANIAPLKMPRAVRLRFALAWM